MGKKALTFLSIYSAPELSITKNIKKSYDKLDEELYAKIMDLWSMGCVAYEILEGKNIYEVISNKLTRKYGSLNKYNIRNISYENWYTLKGIEIIKTCLLTQTLDPRYRTEFILKILDKLFGLKTPIVEDIRLYCKEMFGVELTEDMMQFIVDEFTKEVNKYGLSLEMMPLIQQRILTYSSLPPSYLYTLYNLSTDDTVIRMIKDLRMNIPAEFNQYLLDNSPDHPEDDL